MFAKDKTYSNVGAFVPEIDFNPMEFGIPPKLLESISTQQLLSLMAKEALFDAKMYGKDNENFDKDKVGVILAASVGSTAFSLKSRSDLPLIKKILKNVTY